MINWLIEQQMSFSVLLVLLIFLEAKAIKTLSATLVYALWCLVPLLLIVNSLPKNVFNIDDKSVYHYIVELGTNHQPVDITPNWALVWIIGCITILMLGAIAQWKIVTLIRQGVALKAQKLVIGHPLPKAIKLVSHAQLAGPILSGIFRPTLLLPKDFALHFSQRQQQLILAHELVHFQRSDNLFNLMALILLALFWFNPLSWIAYRAFRRSQELACDAKVLEQSNKQDKISYSKALVQCAEQSLHSFSIYSPYGEKHTMVKRINNIQTTTKIKPALIGLSIALGSCMLAGVALANLGETNINAAQGEKAEPVIRIEPLYPIQAAENKQEGSVILQFDIGTDGSTENIQILESFPRQVFDKVSITALSQWSYKPRIVGGQAQKQTGLTVQLDYRMDNPNSDSSVLKSDIERVQVKR